MSAIFTVRWSQGCCRAGECCREQSLTELQLDTMFSSPAVAALAAALPRNSTLQTLHMQLSPDTASEDAAAIIEALGAPAPHGDNTYGAADGGGIITGCGSALTHLSLRCLQWFSLGDRVADALGRAALASISWIYWPLAAAALVKSSAFM